MKKILIIIAILVFANLYAQNDYTKYVNPFVGTAEHGHTYPGASYPFGMMQLSPDTGVEGWDWCSGYHASDNSIMGFSHTHLSGTGVGDYGDILLMPIVGENKFLPGSKNNPDEGYRSRFSHKNEVATPGYYSVKLDDYNIDVELTVAQRSGIHKYTYLDSEEGKIIIDLSHGIQDATIQSYIHFIDDNKIEGYRTSSGWAKRHTVYFYAEFSEKIKDFTILQDEAIVNKKSSKGQSVKASVVFDLSTQNTVLTKLAISHVSFSGAKQNLQTEIPHWDFNKTKNETKRLWNDWLSRVEIEGGSEDQRVTYYTALYHTFLAPNIFNDVDKKYMGMDGKIRVAEDFNMYTIFSLWDTFRALHPFLTIVDEKLTTDLIKSLINKYEEGGLLPVWELAANETFTMIGYHSIPVIADAYMKGIRNYDVEKAYEAMVHSAMEDRDGLEYYKKMGFIPMDKAHDAVSSALEYAYDDWCIAQVAKDLGKDEDYEYFMSRAKNYINSYNPRTGFMQGRYNSGAWSKDFDPISPSYLGSGEFTEGNSWQYTWFVPQDIEGLKDLIGGDEQFKEKLDSLFTVEADPVKYQMPSDVTGLIGQYAQGNEPSHHIAYLYNYCGYPWETQNILRRIMGEFFHSGRDGLCGNEDCGQMSAWYAFSAIGLYPVLPGNNQYVIGSPLFDKVTIHQENGKSFTIIADNNSDQNKYIESLKLNGNEYQKLFITHDDIRNGSTLKFDMALNPNHAFGINEEARPTSFISDTFTPISYDKYFMPVIKPHRSLFANRIRIELDNFNHNTEIRYTLDGNEPDRNSKKYEKSFEMDNTFVLKAKVFGEDLSPSGVIQKEFRKTIVNDPVEPFLVKAEVIYPNIIENDKYNKNYTGGGKNALIDGNFGNTDFRDPYWQGFQSNDCDIIIDCGELIELNKISASFLQNQGSWIFLPQKVTVALSEDGKNYTEPYVIYESEVTENYDTEIKNFIKEFADTKTRYIHFIADNIGVCPKYHKGAGGEAHIFIDEIVIE